MAAIQRQTQQIQSRMDQLGLLLSLESVQAEIRRFQEAKNVKPGMQLEPPQPTQVLTQQQQQRQPLPQIPMVQTITSQPQPLNVKNLEQFEFRRREVVPPPPPPAPPAKPKKFKFDREFGFCLCREVFEELIERLRFMKKNILRRENIPEGEHDRHISSSQLMLITKYLITSRQQIGEYEETAVVASINQIFLDKLTMEVKFFMKKKDIDITDIYYDPNMFRQSDSELDLSGLFDMIASQRNSQTKPQPDAIANVPKRIV